MLTFCCLAWHYWQMLGVYGTQMSKLSCCFTNFLMASDKAVSFNFNSGELDIYQTQCSDDPLSSKTKDVFHPWDWVCFTSTWKHSLSEGKIISASSSGYMYKPWCAFNLNMRAKFATVTVTGRNFKTFSLFLTFTYVWAMSKWSWKPCHYHSEWFFHVGVNGWQVSVKMTHDRLGLISVLKKRVVTFTTNGYFGFPRPMAGYKIHLYLNLSIRCDGVENSTEWSASSY